MAGASWVVRRVGVRAEAGTEEGSGVGLRAGGHEEVEGKGGREVEGTCQRPGLNKPPPSCQMEYNYP